MYCAFLILYSLGSVFLGLFVVGVVEVNVASGWDNFDVGKIVDDFATNVEKCIWWQQMLKVIFGLSLALLVWQCRNAHILCCFLIIVCKIKVAIYYLKLKSQRWYFKSMKSFSDVKMEPFEWILNVEAFLFFLKEGNSE